MLALQMINKDEQESLANKSVPESGIVYKQMMLGQIRLVANRKQIPTFVIGSSNDRIISKGHNKFAVRKTNATFKEYLNHGHWIIEENGVDLLAADIVNWLNSLS